MVGTWLKLPYRVILACCVALLPIVGCGDDGEAEGVLYEYMVGRYGGETLTVKYSLFRVGGSGEWELEYAVFYKGRLSESLWTDGTLWVYGEHGKQSVECELGDQVWIGEGGVGKNIEHGASVAAYVDLANRPAENWDEGVERFEECQGPDEAIQYLKGLVGNR